MSRARWWRAGLPPPTRSIPTALARVAATAAWLADVSGAEALPAVLDLHAARRGPVLVIGEGSNVLFRNDYPGVVLRIENRGRRILEERADGSRKAVQQALGRGDREAAAHEGPPLLLLVHFLQIASRSASTTAASSLSSTFPIRSATSLPTILPL